MVDVLVDGVEVGKRIVEMECEDATAVLMARSKAATCQGAATMPERGWSKWGQKACPREPIVFGGRCAPLSQGIVSRSDIPMCSMYLSIPSQGHGKEQSCRISRSSPILVSGGSLLDHPMPCL